MRQVIRADSTCSPTRLRTLRNASRAARDTSRAKASPAKTPEQQAFPRRRRSRPGRGRAGGQGRAVPCSPPAPPSRFLMVFFAMSRLAPAPSASAWPCMSAAASAKILRLNADEGALRDLRFAVGDALGPAANLLSAMARSRAPAAQPRPRPDRRRGGAAGSGCGPERPRGQAEGLRRGGRSGFGGRKSRSPGVLRRPGRPSAEAEILALWLFDLDTRHPAALVAAATPDRHENSGPDPAAAGRRSTAKTRRHSLVEHRRRGGRAGRRLRPRPCRRSCPPPKTLIAVAPKLRSKAAAKIVDLLLAEDCLAPAEAARQAPMTGRAARRLFDRLVALGAAREFSGRPTFRLYGL